MEPLTVSWCFVVIVKSDLCEAAKIIVLDLLVNRILVAAANPWSLAGLSCIVPSTLQQMFDFPLARQRACVNFTSS